MIRVSFFVGAAAFSAFLPTSFWASSQAKKKDQGVVSNFLFSAKITKSQALVMDTPKKPFAGDRILGICQIILPSVLPFVDIFQSHLRRLLQRCMEISWH